MSIYNVTANVSFQIRAESLDEANFKWQERGAIFNHNDMAEDDIFFDNLETIDIVEINN
jgi:hypothetical protein